MQLKFDIHFYKRFGFFLLGLGIGIFLLGKFLDKKNASFDYLPNARTLKSIREKAYFTYDAPVLEKMKQKGIDTTAIKSLLYYGDVSFTKENRGKAPCHTYLILPTKKTAQISILVKRCDSTAKVIRLEIK
jgi:hypothetical protein